jgi:hypothetical protein
MKQTAAHPQIKDSVNLLAIDEFQYCHLANNPNADVNACLFDCSLQMAATTVVSALCSAVTPTATRWQCLLLSELIHQLAPSFQVKQRLKKFPVPTHSDHSS